MECLDAELVLPVIASRVRGELCCKIAIYMLLFTVVALKLVVGKWLVVSSEKRQRLDEASNAYSGGKECGQSHQVFLLSCTI